MGVTENSITCYDKLPFFIDEVSFNQWLDDMEKVNKIRALKLMLSTMQLLRKAELPLLSRYVFLQKLSPVVEQICEELRKTYIRNPFPFSKEDKLKLELSVCCARECVRNYSLFCKDSNFSVFTQQQKAQTLFNAIAALNQVHLYKSLVYEKPEKGFWSSCYFFYLFARQHNVVDCVISGQMTRFIDGFKQLLLFELSNTQQFTAEEIVVVFAMLKQVSEEAELLTKVPEKKYRGVPSFNLRKDEPPSISRTEEQQQQQSKLVYISSLKVIKRLLGALSEKQLPVACNKAMLLRLIKTLTMNQQRKTDRELASGEFFAVIGFDAITAFIIDNKKKRGAVKPIPEDLEGVTLDEIFKAKDSVNRITVDDFKNEHQASFAIVDEVGEVGDNIQSSDIWGSEPEQSEQQQQGKESVENENAELLDQSSSGFRLCLKDKMAVVKVGDIVGLIISEIIVITVIRRIIQVQNQQTEVGVERLGGFSELLHIFNTNSKSAVWVLYLNSNEVSESVIIKSNDYHNEAYLFADNDGKVTKYRVEKQLNASAMIRHLKVSQC